MQQYFNSIKVIGICQFIAQFFMRSSHRILLKQMRFQQATKAGDV